MIALKYRAANPLKTKLDVLYVLAVEGEEIHDHYAEMAASIEAAVTRGDFTGKAKQISLFYGNKESKTDRLALVGLGRRETLSAESIRRVISKVWEHARELKAKNIGVVFDHVKLEAGEAIAAAAITEGLTLSSYQFVAHKTTDDKTKKGFRKARPATKTIDCTIFGESRTLTKVVEHAHALASAANTTRQLSDQPGNIATPTYLADQSKVLGKKHGFSVRILEREDLIKEGMGALLAVSQGSVEPANLIIMEHKPKNAKETICLVGKGLTFDAGGISIKPSDKMWEMKYDKCGGTAVIGAMCAIADLDLPFHVYGLVPASENLPDGAAVKPGDIITSLTGHSIEVLNTDAEGRLILSDALGYAHRLKPSVVIDMATLTGGCVVALASIRAGVFGHDTELCADLVAAGDRCGERVWRLPLDQEYNDLLKSDHADLKNIGGRWGSAITAACFLSNFVPPECKWAHIDIAGPAWKSTNTGGKDYLRRGATGFGTRLVVDFLQHRAS